MSHLYGEGERERKTKGLVSIVIPAYNAGKYLREMLESIYAQTYSHIEVIVAYDTKSSDNTLEILQTYSKKYGLIIDIGRDSSSGDARNRGFKLVRGEYVIFMDADDFITSTYIEDLMSIYAEHPKLNAVCGNRIHSSEEEIENNINKAQSSIHSVEVHSQDEALKNMVAGKLYSGEPWTWLVRKHYLNEGSIQFPDYSYGDDTAYVFSLIVNTGYIGYSTKQGYIFINHSTSLTHSVESFLNLYEKRKKSREDIKNILGPKHINIYQQHLGWWNRNLSAHLTKLNYREFRNQLISHKIDKLPTLYGDSILLKMSVYCFNMSKYLYWRIYQHMMR